jgi:flagellar biogenesis protein FliO
LVAYVLLRWLGRKGVGRSDEQVRVLGRCFLEPRRSVYLLEAGGRCFLVGVGEGPMTLLAEIDKAAIPASKGETEKPRAGLSDALANLLRRRR